MEPPPFPFYGETGAVIKVRREGKGYSPIALLTQSKPSQPPGFLFVQIPPSLVEGNRSQGRGIRNANSLLISEDMHMQCTRPLHDSLHIHSLKVSARTPPLPQYVASRGNFEVGDPKEPENGGEG